MAEASTHGLADRIEGLVAFYRANKRLMERVEASILRALDEEKLNVLVHSRKSRFKDPDHLRAELFRKADELKVIEWNDEDLFIKINDLVGFRLLHLHTRQIRDILDIVRANLDEESISIKEGPTARPWDDEYREVFRSLGVDVTPPQDPPKSLYTSVHMVVQTESRRVMTAEIQIRTLAEELWGEVDHAINYPVQHMNPTCRDQLRVLARITSACTRSVDGIFNHLETI